MVPQLKNMNIFYINLKDSLDRKQHFIKFEKNIQRFPAVNAKKYSDNEEFLKKISLMTQSKIFFNSRNTNEEINTIGAIGCSLSHYFLWCSFLDDKIHDDYLNYVDSDEKEEVKKLSFKKNNSIDDEYLFVLEDDASFDYNNDLDTVQKELHGIINNIGDNWDIYLVDSLQKRDDEDFITKENFSIVNSSNFISNTRCKEKYCKVLSFFGTHSYIIKKSAIKKIIEYFYPIECHIDAYLGLLAQKKIINIVGTKNKILTNRLVYSTINHSLIFNNFFFSIMLTIMIILIIIIVVLLVIITNRKKV